MIGRLQGILLEKQAPDLLIDVNGVGYELQAPMSTFYRLPDINKSVTLYTHLVVREDAQVLYGFNDKQERSLFRALIKISGIGPRAALTILSGVDPDTFVQCVVNGDVSTLIKLPGIGRKTAQRLLVEIKDKLAKWDWSSGSGDVTIAAVSASQDALSALLALGYKPQEASRALSKYKDQELSSEDLIKTVLKDLSR